MTPRETIALAIYESFCARVTPGTDPIDAFDDLTHPIRDSYLQQADAVIDALALMEPTDAMIEAYLDQTGDPLSEFGWSAAVGAMRDEEATE